MSTSGPGRCGTQTERTQLHRCKTNTETKWSGWPSTSWRSAPFLVQGWCKCETDLPQVDWLEQQQNLTAESENEPFGNLGKKKKKRWLMSWLCHSLTKTEALLDRCHSSLSLSLSPSDLLRRACVFCGRRLFLWLILLTGTCRGESHRLLICRYHHLQVWQ